jgi:protein TonB
MAAAVALPSARATNAVAPANTAEAADLDAMLSPVPPPPVPAAPTPASPAQAGPPVDALAAEAEDRWQADFLGQLRRLRRYPLVARRLGQEGVAVLDLRVDAEGRLESLDVRRHSGHPLLDQDALRLAREAAAMTRPGRAPGRTLRLEIPIVYRLQDG